MSMLTFLLITFSVFATKAYAGPDTTNSGMAISYQKQLSSECSCSLRKQHQTKRRIEKNKRRNFEPREIITSESEPNG
jgi:hypothetical protein